MITPLILNSLVRYGTCVEQRREHGQVEDTLDDGEEDCLCQAASPPLSQELQAPALLRPVPVSVWQAYSVQDLRKGSSIKNTSDSLD